MIKKKLLIASIVLAFSTTSLFATESTLKDDMLKLNSELREIQQGFISSDKDGLKVSIEKFAKHVEEFLGDEKRIKAMLPEKKKHKANEAIMSAQIIKHNVKIILDAIENKYKRTGIIRREESQRAYTYIEHACFRCHNIVRDAE
jgi:hypothetical protein